ncbi:hypothetical protein RND71_006170 [Anisodus tanguticus]|uniref:Pentatricopeptide repeat-containing protein n=1 Tax=Anisodus tanguticus TaxID=243964 RepID=A0AAE1SQD4_9SOLA|nr:hypothetical protein RND71_006170 [Anisodus tanguticus]
MSLNLRTAAGTRANIIKFGYGMYPSLISLMVVTYVSCDRLNLARQLLVEIPTGYVKNGMYKEALSVFRKMLRSNVEPDGYTFASIITVCARLGAVDHAKWVHHLMTEKRIELNYILSSALIDMYSKCGRIEIARGIFDSVEHTNVSVWNAMINGLAVHGLALDAIEIFSLMGQENVSPDSITLIGLLTACSHSGFVEEVFKRMRGIKRLFKRYSHGQKCFVRFVISAKRFRWLMP